MSKLKIHFNFFLTQRKSRIGAIFMIFFDVLTEMYTCHLLHLLGAEIPLTSLDQILLTFHLAYLSEGVSGFKQFFKTFSTIFLFGYKSSLVIRGVHTHTASQSAATAV